MTWTAVADATAPASATRRAAPASAAGVTTAAAAPALRLALAANTNGSSRRASCHTGTAVFDRSAAVYVASGMPRTAAARRPARPNGAGTSVVQASAAATAVAPPAPTRSHEPTLIGDVTLNSRSMLR